MYLLAVDTSTNVLSITLFNEQVVRMSFNEMTQMQHGVLLVPKVQELLQQAGITPKEINALAIGVGPGSYTGMRIGLTLAKIWAQSYQIPVHPMSTLALIAATAESDTDELIIPLIDARRGTVYTAVYQKDGNGKMKQLSADTHMDWQLWLEHNQHYFSENRTIVLVGEKIQAFAEMLQEKFPELEIIVNEGEKYIPNTSFAYSVMEAAVENVNVLAPNYVQLTLAEREWLEKSKREMTDETLVDTTIQ